MIANCLDASLGPYHFVRSLIETTKWFRKSYAYESIDYKVHFIYFLEFFINYLVFLSRKKSPRYEALCQEKKELSIWGSTSWEEGRIEKS